jgi:AraC family transcriptional regulator
MSREKRPRPQRVLVDVARIPRQCHDLLFWRCCRLGKIAYVAPMPGKIPGGRAARIAAPSAAPRTAPIIAPDVRMLARGEGWSVAEYVCHAGPSDRPFEERHGEVAIAGVVEGSFQYRSRTGSALLYPGSFLLGNAGDCFECRHEHGIGDRCIALSFAPALFEEIAATAAGSARFRFSAPILPAKRSLSAPAVQMQELCEEPVAAAEWAIGIAANVLRAHAGASARAGSISSRDERRISAVLRHIDAHADAPLDLDVLAAVAFMSKYHFLRTFRRVVGMTPYAFLIDVRLRRAALMLVTTRAPIASIAFAAGFGDLSTFNGRFREVFGTTPGAYRARAGGRVSPLGGEGAKPRPGVIS